MPHLGEIISLVVAVLWTATALFSDEASRRIGSLSANVVRLSLASVFLGLLLWVTLGRPWPVFADGKTWLWLALSALVGYVFGDWCLFNCYLSIGARFGQLFMTLAPPIAAIAGWMLLGERLRPTIWLAMAVTLGGIALSILGRESGERRLTFTLPLKGILLGLGAGLGQGFGLVLSKIGLQHYSAALTVDVPSSIGAMLPFASTMVRALVGAAGFLLLMVIRREVPLLRAAVHDRKGMSYALGMTLFGPVLGVSLSLMSVQYTDAGIASTLMALTPILILLPSALLYRQRIRPKEWIGAWVSILGVALFFLL
jgi:drug/metabolite transporter (DMT)-like permease